MSQNPHLQSALEATKSFVARLAVPPCRLEAKVASAEGMPLLCAVEAALAQARARPAAQELVWLSGTAPAGAHVLRLQAFGPAGELLAEAVHEFAA